MLQQQKRRLVKGGVSICFSHSDEVRPNAKSGGKRPDSRCFLQRESGALFAYLYSGRAALAVYPRTKLNRMNSGIDTARVHAQPNSVTFVRIPLSGSPSRE